MYKVIYHYEVSGEAKQLVSDVFMTIEAAKEHVLDAFDRNVEYRNEHDDGSILGEGHMAEICANVIRNAYEIKYVKDL